MKGSIFVSLDDFQLAEHRCALLRAYVESCAAYDQDEADKLHKEMRRVDEELDRRHGADRRRTDAEELPVHDLTNRFINLVIARDQIDDIEESERLYWEIDKILVELERREGDQRRVLFPFYYHPDIRVRQAAADATRVLAPVLSRDRLLAIDDPDWLPPSEGPGQFEATLHGLASQQRVPSLSRHRRPRDMAPDELITRFLAIALEQDEALNADRLSKYNRLFWQLDAVIRELKKRDGDRRWALLQFYSHFSAQVRLKAAIATMELAPDSARRVFQLISDRCEYPQAADARGMLKALDEGRYPEF